MLIKMLVAALVLPPAEEAVVIPEAAIDETALAELAAALGAALGALEATRLVGAATGTVVLMSVARERL